VIREPFQARVKALRESWAERRQVSRLAGSHDFDSQLELLRTLYAWAVEAREDIATVYGDSLLVNISPEPDGTGGAPAFSCTVSDRFAVTFALVERRRATGARWHISVSVASPGTAGGLTYAGPERRNGQWTRGRLEDLLLSVLGAYERSLADIDLLPEGGEADDKTDLAG
jgi:hypothetical protein